MCTLRAFGLDIKQAGHTINCELKGKIEALLMMWCQKKSTNILWQFWNSFSVQVNCCPSLYKCHFICLFFLLEHTVFMFFNLLVYLFWGRPQTCILEAIQQVLICWENFSFSLSVLLFVYRIWTHRCWKHVYCHY